MEEVGDVDDGDSGRYQTLITSYATKFTDYLS